MSEETENLVLELLKRLHRRFDEVQADISEIRTRLGSLESGQALLKAELAHQSGQIAAINARLDRMDDRIGRIERRLDLTEA